MKKIAAIGLLSLCAAAAYAQGTIIFNNYVSGSIVTHIYAPNPSNPTVETTGNSSADTPTGTQSYAGYTAIGGTAGTVGTSGAPNYALGADFSVQLYALGEDNPTGDGSLNPLYNGIHTAFNALQPVSQYITTMSTSSSLPAGTFQAVSPNPDAGIPWCGYNSANQTIDNVAAMSLVCWFNQDNTITSLAAASAAKVPYGESAVFTESALGEPSSVESALNGAGSQGTTGEKITKLTSFSLIGQAVPEPSTIVLGVMGACAFLARRRMK